MNVNFVPSFKARYIIKGNVNEVEEVANRINNIHFAPDYPFQPADPNKCDRYDTVYLTDIDSKNQKNEQILIATNDDVQDTQNYKMNKDRINGKVNSFYAQEIFLKPKEILKEIYGRQANKIAVINAKDALSAINTDSFDYVNGKVVSE